MPIFADYHRTIIGYHGTTREAAERIVLTGQFNPSQRDYDWLGHGVYFWEYAPKQAYHWACQHHRTAAHVAVVASMVRLGNCFDLLDPGNVDLLIEHRKDINKAITKNANSRKYEDCSVLESFYQTQTINKVMIDTARAVYVPTESRKRAWMHSWIYREAHVQLCVRNPENILGSWLVRA